MKVSGRRNPKGKPTAARQSRGATTITPADDKPSRVRAGRDTQASEAEKLEGRKKLPANRTKVKPTGSTAKPRRKAA